MAAVCNQLWTLLDGASTDCHGVNESNRYPLAYPTSRETGSYKMPETLGAHVQELLRIRSEIVAALEQVDEVIAAATPADPR